MKNLPLLLKKLEAISNLLREEYENEIYVGGLAGGAGLSLFQFCYSNFNKNNDCQLGEEMLVNAFQSINDNTSPNYSTGIAGLGWVISFLEEKNLIDLEVDKLLSPLDIYLNNVMISNAKMQNHDFTDGSIGYGFYFLKRFNNTKKSRLKIRYKKYLTNLIQQIKKHSIREGSSIKWNSIIDRETGARGISLSLPHGMITILNFLTRLHNHDEFKEEVEPLIRGGANYLSSIYKNRIKTNISIFPNWIDDSSSFNDNSRLAWCYGDLGIGITIWQMSKVLNDEKLSKFSIKILTHSSKRKNLKLNNVVDTGICHGTFGIAQMFNRMYRETSKKHFKTAATYWIDEGLKMLNQEGEYINYKQLFSENSDNRVKLSIIEGYAGVGLSILDYLDTHDSKWDECLMIS